MNTGSLRARWLSAGYTIVELAVAVTVSGGIAWGVVTFAARLWAEQRADAFAQNMVQLVQSVNAMFPGSSTRYDTLTVKTAIRLGVFTDEQVNAAAASVNHLYGQPISMGGLAGAGLNNQAWGLHYARLPPDACLGVLQYALKVADAVALVSDPSANPDPSDFKDWGAAISWVSGAVDGFPAQYMYTPPGGLSSRVLKRNHMDVPTAVDRIDACNAVTGNGVGSAFGLALVLRRV